MKLSVYSRRYRLHHPFRTSSWSLDARDVFLLCLRTDDGTQAGWGEAAPLPVFGTESHAEAGRVLQDAAEILAQAPVAAASEIEELDRSLPALQRCPAARFALETALLDLEARVLGVSISEFLGGGRSLHIPVNAVIGGGTAEAAAETAAAAEQEGFHCLKMKVGSASLDDDLDRIRAVRSSVSTETALRLDANGAWDFGEAEEALRAFLPYEIEYIEQPVPAYAHDELAALTGMRILPVAADEAAQDADTARLLLERNAADLYVIKPMVMGGFRRAREFALEAQQCGADVVFTSLMDSSVARHAVAQLCASLPQLRRPQGLATGRLFAEDSFHDSIEAGAFVLSGSPGLGMVPVLEER